jgi:hypothetical protein
MAHPYVRRLPQTKVFLQNTQHANVSFRSSFLQLDNQLHVAFRSNHFYMSSFSTSFDLASICRSRPRKIDLQVHASAVDYTTLMRWSTEVASRPQLNDKWTCLPTTWVEHGVQTYKRGVHTLKNRANLTNPTTLHPVFRPHPPYQVSVLVMQSFAILATFVAAAVARPVSNGCVHAHCGKITADADRHCRLARARPIRRRQSSSALAR